MNEKIEQLLMIEGFEPNEEGLMSALEEFAYDSVVPGICLNDTCDYSTSVEADCRAGHCELCNDNSVEALTRLVGII